MSKHFANRAILVLESPWELDDTDANRSSVIPFVEGVAKMTGDTDVHYANFYDGQSFRKALECLCKGELDSRIVYIASHGFGKEISGASMFELLSAVAEKSKEHRIDGVLIGSCYIGENVYAMEACIERSPLRWCVGYTAETNWLDGTLIDCKLLSELSLLDEDDFYTADAAIEGMSEAMSLFDPQAVIATDYDDNEIVVRNGLSFVLQLRGQGHSARNVTDVVWEQIGV